MRAGVWNVNPFDRRVPGGIRTPNLLIRSQLLYPVELQTLLPGGMLKVTEFGGTRKLMFDSRHRAGII